MIAEFKMAFELLDADESGSISKTELSDILQRMGKNVDDEMLDKMFTIDLDEFLGLMINLTVDPPLDAG